MLSGSTRSVLAWDVGRRRPHKRGVFSTGFVRVRGVLYGVLWCS